MNNRASLYITLCLVMILQAVLEGSKEVQRSKRLKRMLEIILAFGNYMNRGQRGNAVGFKLLSLTREETIRILPTSSTKCWGFLPLSPCAIL